MQKQIQQLREFMTAFKQPVRDSIGFPSAEIRILAAKLISEEAEEFKEEMDNPLANMEDAAKELCDLVYVALWSINALGLQDKFEACFNEVHASNMSKLGEDGKPIYRADGKVLKGPNYFKADLTKIL